MSKGWTTMPALQQMSRVEILDANDWLDAIEEAEDKAQRKADEEIKRNRR